MLHHKHPFRFEESESQGRKHPLSPDPYRSEFVRDRDRILHCKSFRRLKHKTQVFLKPDGDHYRTRLTHTLEVCQIARTIGRALGLNEDLVEAIAYGHDLGHTPFGHAGEQVLNHTMPGGFHHVRQSVRVVEVVENDYHGLNLCFEVVDGILKHSKGKGSIRGSEVLRQHTTLEAQVLRMADLIAYLHHDCDDAVRAGVIRESDLPQALQKSLGSSAKQRLDSLVYGVIEANLGVQERDLRIPDALMTSMQEFRAYMFEAVYENPDVKETFKRPQAMLEKICLHYLHHRDHFVRDSEINTRVPQFEDLSSDDQIPYLVDVISGMTDGFALKLGMAYGFI
jgi:dGTPase